jgi:iron complex outermembrane receptor protein
MPDKQTSWTLLGIYQKDNSGSSTAFLPHEGTLYPGPNGKIPVNRFASEPGFEQYKTTSASITSIFEHEFSDALKLRQSTRYAHTEGIYHSMYPDVYTDPANPFLDPARRTMARYTFVSDPNRDTLTSDTNAQSKFSTGAIQHKVLYGLDYRRLKETGVTGDGFDPRPFDLYAPTYHGTTAPTVSPFAPVVQQQTGVYLQDQARMGPWILTAGIRYDRFSSDETGTGKQEENATTGRVGLMYELPNGLTPYVSYAQSFNPVYGANICTGYCKAMKGKQYEAGFKYQPARDIVINGAVYDTEEKNRLASDPTNPFLSIQTGEVRLRGVELEAIAAVTRNLDVIAAYSYIDAQITSGDNTGAHPETVPDHQASLWAKYKFSLFGIPGFSIGAGVRYVGVSWDGTDMLRTPSHTLVDAMVGYEDKHWRWQLNGTNLADNIHVTTCLTRGDCFYGSRRTILSTLTYKY